MVQSRLPRGESTLERDVFHHLTCSLPSQYNITQNIGELSRYSWDCLTRTVSDDFFHRSLDFSHLPDQCPLDHYQQHVLRRPARSAARYCRRAEPVPGCHAGQVRGECRATFVPFTNRADLGLVFDAFRMPPSASVSRLQVFLVAGGALTL